MFGGLFCSVFDDAFVYKYLRTCIQLEVRPQNMLTCVCWFRFKKKKNRNMWNQLSCQTQTVFLYFFHLISSPQFPANWSTLIFNVPTDPIYILVYARFFWSVNRMTLLKRNKKSVYFLTYKHSYAVDPRKVVEMVKRFLGYDCLGRKKLHGKVVFSSRFKDLSQWYA